jgi:ribosomal protein S18 acetylase RimI-like enzyme
MMQIADWARRKGLPKLLISTLQTNVGALRLYRSLGYRPTGRIAAGEMELALTLPLHRPLRKSA